MSKELIIDSIVKETIRSGDNFFGKSFSTFTIRVNYIGHVGFDDMTSLSSLTFKCNTFGLDEDLFGAWISDEMINDIFFQSRICARGKTPKRAARNFCYYIADLLEILEKYYNNNWCSITGRITEYNELIKII